ncbi:MAG: ABC transporter substrate-binding protein, partial [bacterium]
MNARSLSLAAALALAAAGVACGTSASTPAVPLRVAMAPEVSNLDPHRQNTHGGLSVCSNVYESLTAFDPEMRVGPGLAVRWENPDELTWRFHLRPGVLFHDGRALTSADVVKSLERARRPGSSAGGGLRVVRDIAAEGPNVVVIHTTRANPMLLNNLATAFVTPHDAPDDITTPVGTGPYRFVRFEPGRTVELTAWERHWREAPRAAGVSFVFEADPDRRLALLTSGAVDVALRLAENAALTTAAGCRLMWRPAPG